MCFGKSKIWADLRIDLVCRWWVPTSRPSSVPDPTRCQHEACSVLNYNAYLMKS